MKEEGRKKEAPGPEKQTHCRSLREEKGTHTSERDQVWMGAVKKDRPFCDVLLILLVRLG